MSSASPVTVFSIESADCRAAGRAAEVTGDVGRQWCSRAGQARKDARWEEAEEWLGAAAEAASHRIDASVNQWDVVGLSAQGIGFIAGVHVRLLALAQRVVQAALATARLAMMQVSDQGVVSGGPLAAVTAGNAAHGALTAVLTSAVRMVSTSDELAGTAIAAMGSAGSEAIDLAEFADRSPPESSARTAPIQVETVKTTQGTVFIAGDIDRAEEVTTFVSGVGSSSPASMASTQAWANSEVERARAQGRHIAVIAWHGYEAPGSLAAGAGTYPARVAARELAEFQRDVRSRNPRATLNVVGFSYGSLVAGTAARETDGRRGLEADSLTFLGSPGVGVNSAEELHLLRDGEEHTGSVRSEHVPGDLIQLVTGDKRGAHGPDPSAPGFAGSESEEGWNAYRWQRLLDLYILARGDRDTHSSYLWDPSVKITH